MDKYTLTLVKGLDTKPKVEFELRKGISDGRVSLYANGKEIMWIVESGRIFLPAMSGGVGSEKGHLDDLLRDGSNR